MRLGRAKLAVVVERNLPNLKFELANLRGRISLRRLARFLNERHGHDLRDHKRSLWDKFRKAQPITSTSSGYFACFV